MDDTRAKGSTVLFYGKKLIINITENLVQYYRTKHIEIEIDQHFN